MVSGCENFTGMRVLDLCLHTAFFNGKYYLQLLTILWPRVRSQSEEKRG